MKGEARSKERKWIEAFEFILGQKFAGLGKICIFAASKTNISKTKYTNNSKAK